MSKKTTKPPKEDIFMQEKEGVFTDDVLADNLNETDEDLNRVADVEDLYTESNNMATEELEPNDTEIENTEAEIHETDRIFQELDDESETNPKLKTKSRSRKKVIDEKSKDTPEPKKNRKQKESVLAIDIGAEAETLESQEDEIWHEIHNAYRTRRILSGVLGMLEKLETGNTVSIVFYKDMRILIPVSEMMINLENGIDDIQERQNKLLSTMIGLDIDFMIKGIDSKTRSAVASRKDAMLKKRKIFYFDKDSHDQPKIYQGRSVEARIVAVSEKALRIEAFGVECSIKTHNLSWEWISDAREHYSVGDKLVLRITNVRGTTPEELQISAVAKIVSDSQNYETLSKCVVQSKYMGTITRIYKGVVFLRLMGGINAVAHSCYDKRRPGKGDNVCFVVTRIDMDKNVAVGLISRIIKPNI